jgi:LacI family transcriptional regulator
LRATGIPLVNLKSSSDASLEPADVETDRIAIGRIAAEHLLERGFRQFAFIGIPGLAWSDRELAGFQQRLQEEGCSCAAFPWNRDDVKTYRDGGASEVIDSIAGWLTDLKKPLGVLSADDYLGIQVLNGCQHASIPVPDAVAVVGVDNEETICRLGYPPLSSVAPNDVKIGRAAAELLDRLMSGEETGYGAALSIPPLDVITRHSTDVTATSCPVVSQAMFFIRQHCTEGINVRDVVQHLRVSRSVIQRSFRKELNRSVYEVILAQRLQHVKELLRDSKLPLSEIAERSGFKHVEHMNNLFKQKTGSSLTSYRSKG